MWLYIIIAIVAVIIIYALIFYNSAVRANNNVKEAFATMDVYLKKRWDLIPNMVETVKGYAKHEKDTFKEIVSLRNGIYDDLSDNEKITKNEEISGKISRIMALAESYPELKADKNFLSLQEDLSKIEDEIAQSRKYYNAVVRIFNNKIEIFPNNIFSKIFGYKTKKMFEADENERKNIQVKL